MQAQWLDAYIPDFKVNDDNLNSYQTNSVIGVDSAGNFVIAWNDVRNNPGDQSPTQIYCQRYNKDGLALGSNFRIGQDTAFFPKITTLNDGRFILCWINLHGGLQLYEFYYQRFNKNGIAIAAPEKIIDTSYYYSLVNLSGFSISSDTTGNFIICWSKAHTYNSKKNTFFQRYDSSGVKIGGIDSVNEANSNAEFPSVAMNYDGSFAVAWQDDRNGGSQIYDIYMQRYNNSGIKFGNNVKVNDDNNPTVKQLLPKISTDGFGRIILVWNDERSCNLGEVYFQIYDQNGNAISVNKKANNSNCNIGTGNQIVSIRKDKKFFIAWSDWNEQGREQFYGRRFDSTGNPIGPQYMIPSSSPAGTKQRANDIKLLGDKIYSTWHDNRNGGTFNYDIYCNVRGFQNPDTVIGIINITNTSNEFKLYSAYPNPFNPVTIIKYSILSNVKSQLQGQSGTANVKLIVYDITGKEIIKLVDKEQSAGIYTIHFTGNGFASGIYFYSLIINGSIIDTKSMVLLK